MRRLAVVCLTIALGACAAPQRAAAHSISGDAACVIKADDAAWLKAASDAWRLIEHGALRRSPMSARPSYVFYDATCAFRSGDGQAWVAAVHAGAVGLPDGQSLPPQVASFAAPGESGQPFMVMGLPSVWRAGGVTSEMGLENLMFAVFTHEMAHLLQFATYSTRIDALGAAIGAGDDLTDDVVQDRFKADPDFLASVMRETELLFEALEGDAATGRAKVREALGLMNARRSRYFVGDVAALNELEDVFLTMEGLGQFAGYAWLVDTRGGGMSAAAALPGMRRGGRQWSQDQGLAIFLALDRFAPDWPEWAFGAQQETALQMLAKAAST